jgi:hypothetical protein
LGFKYKGAVAKQLYELIGERCGTVFFNVPWPGRSNPGKPVYPAEGYIASLLSALPQEQQSAGFDVTDSPFGRILLQESFFAEGKDKVYLKDLCSGFLVINPIKQYVPATTIPGFINAENLAAAQLNFPGPKKEALTIDKLNAEIENNVKQLSKMLTLFE